MLFENAPKKRPTYPVIPSSGRDQKPALLATFCLVLSVWLCLPLQACGNDDDKASRQIEFNRDIRPILSENCFYCHGQDANQRQADLRLDQRESALDAGAIVPGDVDASALIERILTDDPDLQMPPADSNRKLTDHQKKQLQQWVQQGGDYQVHWAFETPARPALPSVENTDWCQNPIDRFVLAQLERQHHSPSEAADRHTLIKRLYSDLLGLPPTPGQVQAFVSDPDPQAYSKLVDQLLDSPHYGERMALPWLDAARYADSNGFQQDGDHWQWMWRDLLVDLLNRNQPFDEFTIWQLAGDLLPDANEEQKIASGFNRNHMLNGEGGAIAEEQRWVNLFDRVDTTATTWLGLTMACGQCHDHKYDPISQTEYYQFLDAFNRVPESGVPRFFSSRIRVADPFLELPTEENRKHIQELEKQMAAHQQVVQEAANNAYLGWASAIPQVGQAALDHEAFTEANEDVKAIVPLPENQRNATQRDTLSTYLRQYFDKSVLPGLKQLSGVAQREQKQQELNAYRADQIPRVMIMSDARPRETHRLDRGQYLNPLEKVEFGTPAFLPPLAPEQPRNRLGLARWLVSAEHPLTARVQVNRMWQQFFGYGLVKTSEDFGVQSQYPVHLDLLNWLAVEFRDSGWNVKHMHRLMLNSATYRQSSEASADDLQWDPENQWLARAARMRMPSLVLRDWALAASGLLNRKMGGAPVYPYQPDHVWESLAITKERDFTYPQSQGDDLYRRSLYTFWRRTVGPANMFDASNRQTCRVRSPITSTPLHALTTLNDPTWVEAARHLACQVMKPYATHTSPDESTDEAQLRQAIGEAVFRVLCRPASESEIERLYRRFEQWKQRYRETPDLAEQLLSVGASPCEGGMPRAEQAALTVTCLTIMNLDEALTRE